MLKRYQHVSNPESSETCRKALIRILKTSWYSNLRLLSPARHLSDSRLLGLTFITLWLNCNSIAKQAGPRDWEMFSLPRLRLDAQRLAEIITARKANKSARINAKISFVCFARPVGVFPWRGVQVWIGSPRKNEQSEIQDTKRLTRRSRVSSTAHLNYLSEQRNRSDAFGIGAPQHFADFIVCKKKIKISKRFSVFFFWPRENFAFRKC